MAKFPMLTAHWCLLSAEMHGYVSADRYFADIRNSDGYG